MYNVRIIVPIDLTGDELIEKICEVTGLDRDDNFAFSAIMQNEQTDTTRTCVLKLNCLDEEEILNNPYSPATIVQQLLINMNQNKDANKNVFFVRPPLEQFFTIFKPMLYKMINKAYPYYKNLIPEKEELMCILNLSIVTLYNKGYYLHNRLIYKVFINQLNGEVRKIKYFENSQSLDEVNQDTLLSLSNILYDESSTDEAYAQMHYTIDDYRQDMFEALKSAILEDLGSLTFNRILIQLKTKTVDGKTSRILSRYRDEFNPDYDPRQTKQSRKPRQN